MSVQPNKQAKSVIDNNKFMTVATVNQDGVPWNTPVAFYHFDNDYNLYWASWVDSQHSKNIRTSGKVFIAIFDSSPAVKEPLTGVYIQADAIELIDEQEVIHTALVFGDDPYNLNDGKEYLGEKPRRMYKAVPQEIWINSDGEINGNFIDIRKDATI